MLCYQIIKAFAMKIFLWILLTTLSIGYASAQDTLRKILEYDVRIEDALQADVPWLKAYIDTAGKEQWVSKLLHDLAAGKIKGYEAYDNMDALPAKWFQDGLNGTPDTIVTVDPITFEEEIEIIEVEPWDIKKVFAICIRNKETWHGENSKY